MKKFIKNITAYLSIFLVLVVVFEYATAKLIATNAEFKIKSNPKYIVLGHSHPECAFIDSLITDFSNFAESREPFLYTHIKAQKLLEQNVSIKTVFIEFTNNQIGESMNQWMWDKESLSYRYPKFSPFMNYKDKLFLLQKNSTGFFNAFSLSSSDRITQISESNYDYTDDLGGYFFIDKTNIDSILNTSIDEKSNTFHANINTDAIIYNVEYLKDVIKLCKAHSVDVFLIRSPVHQKYPGYNNEESFQTILSKHFSEIEFLDFSKFPIKNEEFGDLEHLNIRGASIFSKWFQQTLNKGLLQSERKQEFINSEIRNYKLRDSID